MQVKDAIQQRRSIKHFDPSHVMTKNEIDTLLSHAILSPTAFNIQNWRFVVVTDKALRQKIREVSWGQAQVEEASLFIVLVGDLMAWNKDPARYWKNAPQPVQDYLVPAIHPYYDGKPQVQRDEVMRSCGMAAMNLMLHAKSMGYDSCPMDGFDFDKVAELLNLPKDHTPAMFVCIGKGIKEAWPRGGQLPLNEVIIENQFK
ncbi:MAG: nitroreductase family protein [Gammaproteobacteria bacterium]|nr:nitroreductase family protein [Gammaproteobacteria bacterium]